MIRSDSQLKFLCPLAALVAMAWSSTATADLVYGVTGVGGAPSVLYSETYTNGVGQPSGGSFVAVGGSGAVTLGVSGPALSLSAIAYTNGLLYGITNSMGGSVNGNGLYENSLVTINTSTGVAALVNGNLGTGAQVQSLAYGNGMLYGFSKAGVGSSPVSNSLVTISTSTGLASALGSGTGITQTTTGNGLAVDSSGNIYLSPFSITGSPPNTMYSVDKNTGVATSGLGFTNVPLSSSNMKALAFDSSGNFYGLNFQPNTTTDLVSLTNTGTSWQLGNLGTTPAPFVGVTFAAVPEPGGFVLVGLVATAIGLCCWARRRRERVAAS